MIFKTLQMTAVGLVFMMIALTSCSSTNSSESPYQGKIMTVSGEIDPDSLGLTLIHEHVFLDWSGAEEIDPTSWKLDHVFDVVLPYLQEMKVQGVNSFLECTPAYLGRNPSLLKQLSDTTGLQIITNTGYYAARNFVYLPPQFYTQTAEQVAGIWIKEFQEGIEGTRIRPGFIKIGVDSKDQLTAADTKLVEAAGLTHLATGLTIVAHTGDDTTAVQELSILEDLDVAPDAFVWTHAQNGTSQGHLRLAREGTWISLDGMGWIEPDSVSRDSSGINQYVNFLVNLKQAGLLDRMLISHDAGWYTAGASDQSAYKGYTGIFKWIIPALYKAGFTAADMEKLLIDNPKEAYTIRVRHR